MKPHNTSILSIGECMVELSPTGADTYKMAYAGDTFNTAWYLKQRLPEPWQVSYLTCVGNDPTSQDMVRFIGKAGICTDHITCIEGETTGLYMIHLDQGERSFSYWRENSAARNLASDPDRLDKAMQSAGAIYFSGITVAILPEGGRDNLIAALTRARTAGRQIIFDPNLRPALWSGTDIMCREISRAASVADIVLPSYDDEARYFGDANPHDTIARYQALGANLVVLKNGAGEIQAAGTDGFRCSCAPDPVQSPTDTTAAGDSFNAGFLAAYLTGDCIETAIKSGATLAAKTIRQPGALVDIS